MPRIILIGKPYSEQRGKPSLIGNDGGLPTSGQNVNNSGGRPFFVGGNNPLIDSGSNPPGSSSNNPPRGRGNEPPRDQNPRSYVVGP